MEEKGILIYQKRLPNKYDLMIVPKMVTMQVEFEFRKQEEVR